MYNALVTPTEIRLLFPQLLGKLLTYASEQNILLEVGECYRTPEQAKLNAAAGVGISNSLHTDRCAIDLLVFRKEGPSTWKYLSAGTEEEYTRLSTHWKSLHSQCRWGGDFTHKPDPGHFSLTFDKRA